MYTHSFKMKLLPLHHTIHAFDPKEWLLRGEYDLYMYFYLCAISIIRFPFHESHVYVVYRFLEMTPSI